MLVSTKTSHTEGRADDLVAYAGKRRASREFWSFGLLMVIALIWLYQSPYIASDLPLTPDSVEYAVAPLQFLETGRYELSIQGRGLPPRYPPWFSVMMIVPAYVLFGHQPGNAILPITAMALAGVVLAWRIGHRISSTPGSILSGFAVLALPSYSTLAGCVMTDVPCIAIMFATCLLYLRLQSKPSSLKHHLIAGVLVAIAMLFRPVFAAMLLPFLVSIIRARQKLASRVPVLLLPIAAAVSVTLLYNRATFGSALRNGYHFWTPVPADYPAMAFSLRYLPANAAVIAHTALPILIIAAVVLWFLLKTRYRSLLEEINQPLRHALLFFLLSTVPMLLFHVVYFFPADRFYLPVMAGAAVIGGALAGHLIRNNWASTSKILLPGMLLLAIGLRSTMPTLFPLRRMAADRVQRYTPENALIISEIDPVYLECMAARGSARRIVPLSRDVEYASKLVAPVRIDHPLPPPANWHDHRAPGLLRGGAQEAVPLVASEQLGAVLAEAQKGTPVFFEGTFVDPSATQIIHQFKTRFGFTRRAPGLYELRPL